MGEFTAGLRQRVLDAETSLHRALEDDDEFCADVHRSDLEDLHRLAASHGVVLHEHA
ncbi:MAG: hypothetical protein ACRDPT_06280 [Streptomycetales bacterium]